MADVSLKQMVTWLMLILATAWGAPVSETFQPSVSLAKVGTALEVTVAFKIAPQAHLYQESMTVKVAGGETTWVSGDAPDTLDGDAVFTHDFKSIYQVKGDVTPPLTVTVSYMGCLDAGMCLPPTSRTFSVNLEEAVMQEVPKAAQLKQDAEASTVVLGKFAGYKSRDEFLSWLDDVEAGVVRDERDNVLTRVFRRYGLWLALLLMVPLGIALNLTPCVLPMIPVTLAVIGAGANAGWRRGAANGLAYGLGMALAYGACGLAVVLTGGQFGALNGYAWFNGAVTIVFVLLGLSMFELFAIDLSRIRNWRLFAKKDEFPMVPPSPQGGKRLAKSFLLGALAALLAGACVAPVLIWVLLLSADLYSSGAYAGLFLPFWLGIGMALPWPLLGAGLAKLPRPGGWMVRIRQLMGVLILVLAVYYGWVCVRQLRGHASDDLRGWEHDWTVAQARAVAEGKPLFVDFWGLSCKNCELMDATVFSDETVQKRLERYVKVKVQGDKADDAEAALLMERFGVQGFPTYNVVEVKTLSEVK